MIKENIQQLCDESGISLTALEKKLGFANSTIARWDKFSPRIDNLLKVANYFQVPIQYLLRDEENSQREEHFEERRHTEQNKRATDFDAQNILQELSTIIKQYGGETLSPETRKIPIVGTITCGDNGLAYEDIDGYLMIDESLHGDFIVLRTKGESMQGVGIEDNDLAIIRIQDDIESGEIAAVIINGEESTLKRVIKSPLGIALEGANPNYTTRYFTGEEINNVRIIGKLVEVRKRF